MRQAFRSMQALNWQGSAVSASWRSMSLRADALAVTSSVVMVFAPV